MIVNGLDRIMISVADMDASIAFYRDRMGMEIVGKQTLPRDVLRNLWGMPEGTGAEAVFLRKGDRPTLVELVAFTPAPERCIRPEGSENYNCGLYDIGFRVKDMEASYDILKKEYAFINPPKTYKAPWTDVTVKEVVMITPDRVRNAFMQSGTVALEGDFGLVTTNAHFVEDIEAANRFYKDVLGFSIVFDKVMPEGLVNSILGIPEDCAPRISMAFKPGSKAPVPEFIECAYKGVNVNDTAGPTDIGMFAVAYEVEDLKAVMEKAEANGSRILSEPAAYAVPSVGRIEAVWVEGPAKVKHELYQRIQD